MPHELKEDLVAEFEANGVVKLPSVLSGKILDDAVTAAEEMLAAEAQLVEQNQYFKRLGLWRRIPAFSTVAIENGLAGRAAALLRSEKINILYDQLFVKEPGNRAPTPWHNDLPYWPLTGAQVVTLWIAFDEIGLENGGLEFFAGSHKWQRHYRPFDTTDDGRVARLFYAGEEDTYDELLDFEAERGRHTMLSWDLKPGDAVAFHALTVHGAPGNPLLDRPRRGYAIRYAGDDIRYRQGSAWNKDLMSDELGHGDPLDSDRFPVVYSLS
ncbi:MAG: phytanoyl-CoA dioxygenase family protein [Pseudomonadota bacterium]